MINKMTCCPGVKRWWAVIFTHFIDYFSILCDFWVASLFRLQAKWDSSRTKTYCAKREIIIKKSSSEWKMCKWIVTMRRRRRKMNRNDLAHWTRVIDERNALVKHHYVKKRRFICVRHYYCTGYYTPDKHLMPNQCSNLRNPTDFQSQRQNPRVYLHVRLRNKSNDDIWYAQIHSVHSA